MNYRNRRFFSYVFYFLLLWGAGGAGLVCAEGLNGQNASTLPLIEVLGLFNKQAVLKIDGTQHFLRVGQAPVSGVQLVSSNSRFAVIQHAGVKYELGLSQAIGSRFKAPDKTIVTIALNERSQYETPGSINGRPVMFLVDTGASIVAMNRNTAKQLGIQFRLHGRRSGVITASGTASSFQVLLDKVKVGEITLSNVEAVVVDADYPLTPLLGMTFLKRLDIREQEGVMYLTQKY